MKAPSPDMSTKLFQPFDVVAISKEKVFTANLSSLGVFYGSLPQALKIFNQPLVTAAKFSFQLPIVYLFRYN